MNGDRKSVESDELIQPLGPMDFSTFIMSLGSSAMVNLGIVQAPEDEEGTYPVDLAAAKQMIEILDILRDKTKGNLTASEDKLLTSLLYDLRVAFVDSKKSDVKK